MAERVAPRLRRSWVQRGIILMNLMLIAVSLGAAVLLNYGYGRAASINRVALGRSLTPVPDDLQPGERVMNILLVGSDSSARLDDDDPIQVGRRGERFGDVIIIAHIDERSGEIALLSLPRDLWVEIAGTGRSGRINRAFESGGPATLIDTIESEFDIPIHHYVNVDFAGFQGLVSAVGSVEVYFETPARDWNVNASPGPRSQTGFIVAEAGCQSLDPEMALAYVRSRYYQTQNEDGEWVTDPTSDLGRIRRQQDFLRRVVQKAIDMGARNPFVLRDLVDAGLENVAIDQRLTPQLLVDIGMTYRSFDPERLQTYSFPSVDGRVGVNQVLLPRPVEAEPVLALFQGAGFDDPSTVRLTVLSAPGNDDSGRKNQTGVGPAAQRIDQLDRLAELRRAGFEFDRSIDSDLSPGTTIHHGPDGRHAAELVAEALGGASRLEQVGWLAGRSLELHLGPGPDWATPADQGQDAVASPGRAAPNTGAPNDADGPEVTPDPSVALHPTEIPGIEADERSGDRPSYTDAIDAIGEDGPDSAGSELGSGAGTCG